MSRQLHEVRWIGLVILLLGQVGSRCLAGDTGESTRDCDDHPDIVLFLVDDLGWQDTSVAMNGVPTEFQTHFHTPNVERLARQGVRFSQAYACPVCSPTRVSILTGQNAARHRVTNWTLYADRETSGKTERLMAPRGWNRSGVSPGAPRLPEHLQWAGYTTIFCGKAHFGAFHTPAADPLQLGFQVNLAGHAAGAPGSYQGRDNFGNLPDGAWREPWGVPGLEKYHGQDVHLTDALATEAVHALQAADPERPIFLWMAPYAVHTPLQPHARFMQPDSVHMYTNGEPIPEVELAYRSMVAGVDAALGAILDELKRSGRARKTLVIFTSDNGGLSAVARGTTPRGTGKDTHNWPLREGKGSAYEGGTRVPLIISWAEVDSQAPCQQQLQISGNSIVLPPVISEDLFATILNSAGIATTRYDASDRAPSVIAEASVAAPIPCDGVDLGPMLRGGSGPADRELLFHYPHVWGPEGAGYQPHSALRYGDWKVIYFYQPRRWELYHLRDDISEQNDRSRSDPEKLAEMSERLVKALTARQALFPFDDQRGQPESPILPPPADGEVQRSEREL